MKQLLDYIPLILFFVSFKLLGIYPATAIMMVSSAILYGYLWFHNGKLGDTDKLVLGLTLAAGGLTLAFHNPAFLKWKPTIIYWVFATGLLSGKASMRMLLGHALELPDPVWKRLNVAWIAFFLAMGVLNLCIAYRFDLETWIKFKVFGSLALTFLFLLGQMFYIAPHLPPETPKGPES